MENCVHQMYRTLKFLKKKKIEFVECTNSWKCDGKSMNIPNHDNSLENCVHKMYKQSGLVDKFDFIEYKIVKNSKENYVDQMYRSFKFV